MPRKSRRTNHPSNMKSTPLVKYKAAAYCRLSNTNEESESLKNQMDYIEKYISEQPDMELTVRFCDEGQTGTNYNRRGFQDMMEAIRNREINCVVVKDLSRLGRNFLETGELIEITLPSLNVRLIAINDFYDSAMELSVNDALQFELQNLANEYYSKDISLKTSSAMTTLREKGAFLGNCAPYGYQKHANNKHKLVVDIPAAEIVRHIFEMKAKGMSYGAIARHLTAEGIASPGLYKTQHIIRTTAMTANENPWSVPMIKNILTNPVYLGHMVQGRRSSTGNDVTIMNTHEAIIEPLLYEEAQAKIKKNRSVYFESHGRYSHFEETENILKGYVYCGECGGRLTRRKEIYADGSKRQYVYVCARHDSHGNEICANKFRMHETLLLKSVLEQIQEYIFNIFNGTALSASKAFQVQKTTVIREMAETEERIKGITADKCVIFKAYVEEHLSADNFRIQLDELINKQKHQEKELQTYRHELALLEIKEAEDAVLRKRLLPFQNMTVLNADVLKSLVYRIIISDAGEVSIKYKG